MDNQTDQDKAPVAPASQSTNAPRTSSPKFLILIVVALVAALIASTGTYLALKQSNPPTQNIAQTPPSPTPTPDPTADWKEYISPNGYSFKYPSDMSIKIAPDVTSAAYEVQIQNNDYNISFRKPTITDKTLEQALDQHIAEFKEDTIKKTGSLLVSGKTAFRMEGQLNTEEDIYRINEAVSLKDRKYLHIETNALRGISPDTLRNFLDQILSTFKFTDQDQVVLPQPVKLAKEDLAKQLYASASNIEVVNVEERIWDDRSLGCQKEGFVYAQVITPGYRVTFRYAEKLYYYNTDENKNFVQC